MVDISSYAPSLAAVGAARASTTQATKVATSYGERPTYRDDAVTAGTAIKAMSSTISRLNDVRSLERIDGLLDVTLATTDAIVDTLTEMKTLAANLQDQSLSADMRATLSNEYNKLVPRIGELTKMASFGGRNLLNPDAAQISGDLELPDGQVIKAQNFSKDGPVAGNLAGYIKAPSLDNIMNALDFDADTFMPNESPGMLGQNFSSGASRSVVERERTDHSLNIESGTLVNTFDGVDVFGAGISFKAENNNNLLQYSFRSNWFSISTDENSDIKIEFLRTGDSQVSSSTI